MAASAKSRRAAAQSKRIAWRGSGAAQTLRRNDGWRIGYGGNQVSSISVCESVAALAFSSWQCGGGPA